MVNLFIFLFLGTCGWGVSLCLVKVLLVNLTPVEIVFYRAFIGALTLLLLAKILKLKNFQWNNLLLDGLVIGILNMALPFYLTTLAERSVSSALASVMNGLTPLCSFILSLCFFSNRARLNLIQGLSLGLGLFGIALVHYEAFSGQTNPFHLLALVGTCFSYALAAIYVKAWSKTKEPILLSAMAATISSFLMLACQWVSVSHLQWGWPADWKQLAALLWLGIVGTGLSLYLYCLLIQRTGPVIASMITYLMTVTGVLLGILFLNETLSPPVLLGCIAILVSLAMMNHGRQVKAVFIKKG